ncbi:hypothetical protein ACQEVF_56555 [Nonomuraea polychroma]|uniref:hypothetical protein n=1 Tax=Nonomuraea polychroma TaxID=46176 RepID=UPI003D92B264
MRRRQLLTNLALTAAAATSSPLLHAGAPVSEADAGDLLTTRIRDAMLGLCQASADVPAEQLHTALAFAHADFHACRYLSLAERLPLLLATAHAAADGTTGSAGLLAEVYTLITRMLVKLDDQQLGWMTADRARVLAAGADRPLLVAEAARQLAVLARKAGWHDQAMTIALTAADHPALVDQPDDPRHIAERGPLLQSAAYTAARSGDQAIYAAGDVGAAIMAARQIRPANLPTTERRSRYYTDVARVHNLAGGRDRCLAALLAAERHAPEETHSRPAVRGLVQSLLISGRTSPDLRGLARRCGIP